MLACECGGQLVIGDSVDFDDGAFVEEYECVTCARTGTYRVDEHGRDDATGCVTFTIEVEF